MYVCLRMIVRAKESVFAFAYEKGMVDKVAEKQGSKESEGNRVEER